MRCSCLDAKCALLFLSIALLLANWSALHVVGVAGDTFTLGYLTGSQRRPGDYEYDRPGNLDSIRGPLL